MDNIIKIYLRKTGSIAELIKTIPLYVGMYNTAILDVYVPTALITENMSVKVGAILTANDGTKATTDSLPMTYKGQEREYNIYEINPFPANFLNYAGIQDLIVNITQLDEEQIERVVTTQIAKIDVLDSALIPDEELSTSAVDIFNARISRNEQNIDVNRENIEANTSQITTNTANISSNTSRIAELERTISFGETYIGKLDVETLENIDIRLNQLVQEVKQREARNGDVIIVTLNIIGETDKSFKFFYTAEGWEKYEIPPIESASNTDKGIIKGSFGENLDTQVDISDGEIQAIYVKDNNGNLRDIREYANTTKTTISNIINGITKVGHTVRADQDENGNNIIGTYMTQNSGVTKSQMREYALPREFNDLYFLSKNEENEPIFAQERPNYAITFEKSVATIGTTELLTAKYNSTATFELSQKNSYQLALYVSASQDTTCQFRADVSSGDTQLSVDLSNEIVMTANNVYKIQFNSNFNEILGIFNYNGQSISVTFSVVTTSSAETTYTIYQNSTYISTFNINTNKYAIEMQSGNLGEIKAINSYGVVADDVVTFNVDYDFKNSTLIEFNFTYEGDTGKYVKLMNGQEEIILKTPYNTIVYEDRPTVIDFTQTSVVEDSGIVTIKFIGYVEIIEGYGTVVYVQEDDLKGFATKQELEELKLFKFPNAVIIGDPTINNGQIGGFSQNNYLIFPFVLDVGDRNFQIDFSFTTGNDVIQQQNIMDSYFGIALAIKNGKGLMAISSNGASWNGSVEGTFNILPNTTYYARLIWNKLQYKTSLSVDGVNYTEDMVFTMAIKPYPRTIYIGGGNATELQRLANPFSGIINMNKASLTVGGSVIWQGMDDVGLATRADVSLSNLDSAGKDVIRAEVSPLLMNKVDKSTNTHSLYGTDNSGNQTTIEYSSSKDNAQNKIVQRDANRDVLVPSTPTSNNSATSKVYVDTGLNSRVGKTSTSNQVYTTDNSGNQTTRTIKETNTFSDLGWEDSANHHKIPDISTLAFWDGAFQNNKSSNLKYCAGGEIALKSAVTPTTWQSATPNTTTLHAGTCEFCKVGKIVFCYIDGVTINSGISGGGSGVVELFTGLPITNKPIVFSLPAYYTNIGADIRCFLNNGTISLHWSSEASFGDTGNHHNLIFSYVEA